MTVRRRRPFMHAAANRLPSVHVLLDTSGHQLIKLVQHMYVRSRRCIHFYIFRNPIKTLRDFEVMSLLSTLSWSGSMDSASRIHVWPCSVNFISPMYQLHVPKYFVNFIIQENVIGSTCLKKILFNFEKTFTGQCFSDIRFRP